MRVATGLTGRNQRVAIALTLGLVGGLLGGSVFTTAAEATVFRGCFSSGPNLDGSANMDFDGDVDLITDALKMDPGGWNPANITELKNGTLTQITDCIGAAKTVSKSGDEFVFFFSGHGGSTLFPDAAEAGEDAPGDEHIRVADMPLGTPSRITDDALADLLSGFMQSVTINVLLDSCHSYGFTGGADDLGSITQKGGGGADVAAGDHVAVLTSTTAAMPTCGQGWTKNLADGLDDYDADKNKDGTITTEELGMFVMNYEQDGIGKCDGDSCIFDPIGETTYFGEAGCGPLDSDGICTRVKAVSEPSSVALLAVLAGLITLRRRRR